MLLSATDRGRLAGAILNDVGPVIDPVGLERIKGYVGRSQNWPTWLHAARALAEVNATVYPDYRLSDWLDMAKRLCRLSPGGRIVFDYDMKIAEPFRLPGGEGGVDLWPALESLGDVPLLLVRGALSDLLSAETARQMQQRLPRMRYCEVPRAGHTPTLGEPEAIQAIEALLADVEGV